MFMCSLFGCLFMWPTKHSLCPRVLWAGLRALVKERERERQRLIPRSPFIYVAILSTFCFSLCFALSLSGLCVHHSSPWPRQMVCFGWLWSCSWWNCSLPCCWTRCWWPWSARPSSLNKMRKSLDWDNALVFVSIDCHRKRWISLAPCFLVVMRGQFHDFQRPEGYNPTKLSIFVRYTVNRYETFACICSEMLGCSVWFTHLPSKACFPAANSDSW